MYKLPAGSAEIGVDKNAAVKKKILNREFVDLFLLLTNWFFYTCPNGTGQELISSC